MAEFWIGNQRVAGYRPAPSSGMDADFVGTTETLGFQDGGAHVENSIGTHREFSMSWGLQEYADMQWLPNIRNGVYGNGLIYFVDPFVTNALPPHWARPELTLDGWPSLVENRIQPVESVTPANAYGLPSRGATYTFTPSAVGARAWRGLVLLIPNDRNLHLGFSGTMSSNTRLRAELTSVTGVVSTQDLTLLPAAGAARTNTVLSGAQYRSVRVYPTTADLGSASITLYSGMARYSAPSAVTAYTGTHLEGQGHSGLRPEGSPTLVYVQAAEGRTLVTSAQKFTEVGSWI